MLKSNVGLWAGIGTLLCGLLMPLASNDSAIDPADQESLRGGGDDIACIGSYPCTACVPPAGCAVTGSFGYVWCTSNGTEGCYSAANAASCAPSPGASCTQTIDTSCGGHAVPKVTTAYNAATGVTTIDQEFCDTDPNSAMGYCDGCS
jgi:hypothetical protein